VERTCLRPPPVDRDQLTCHGGKEVGDSDEVIEHLRQVLAGADTRRVQRHWPEFVL